MELESYVESLNSQGKLIDGAEITVDRVGAWRKICQYQTADFGHVCNLLIRAFNLLGASKLKLRWNRSNLRLSCPELLELPMDWLEDPVAWAIGHEEKVSRFLAMAWLGLEGLKASRISFSRGQEVLALLGQPVRPAGRGSVLVASWEQAQLIPGNAEYWLHDTNAYRLPSVFSTSSWKLFLAPFRSRRERAIVPAPPQKRAYSYRCTERLQQLIPSGTVAMAYLAASAGQGLGTLVNELTRASFPFHRPLKCRGLAWIARAESQYVVPIVPDLCTVRYLEEGVRQVACGFMGHPLLEAGALIQFRQPGEEAMAQLVPVQGGQRLQRIEYPKLPPVLVVHLASGLPTDLGGYQALRGHPQTEAWIEEVVKQVYRCCVEILARLRAWTPPRQLSARARARPGKFLSGGVLGALGALGGLALASQSGMTDVFWPFVIAPSSYLGALLSTGGKESQRVGEERLLLERGVLVEYFQEMMEQIREEHPHLNLPVARTAKTVRDGL